MNDKLTKEEREKNFETLKNFFWEDFNLKNELIKSAPNPEDDYDESSRMDYIDRLVDELKYMKDVFITLSTALKLGEGNIEKMNDFFERMQKKLLTARYDGGEPRRIYQSVMASMTPQFIEEVKGTFVGYTYATEDSSALNDIIQQASSVNELLHAMHSYVINNENILKSQVQIASKQNSTRYPITLYGEENKVSRDIFDNWPKELECGYTDIISMKNQILMMIRDRGHALTIELDLSEDEKVMIRYFSPKVCNVDKTSKLPGVNGISMNGSKGSFEVDSREATQKLFEFIEMVPTDKDIPRGISWSEQIDQINALKTQYSIQDVQEFARNSKDIGVSSIRKITKKIRGFFKKEKVQENNNYGGEEI